MNHNSEVKVIRVSRSILLAAALAAACAPAWPASPSEIQVYTDDIEEPGELGMELHINTTPKGRSTPDYPGELASHHGLRVTPEISWGLAPNWDAGIYLPFVRSAEGTHYFAGPHLRLKWLPLRPAEGAAGPFAGINVEVAFVERRFEEARRTAEFRPIIGYRNADWLLSFNPIIETDLAGEQKGVLTFAPAFKVARTVSNRTALGVEYYSDLGRLSHFLPRSEQEHTLFLVLDTPRINFGIGRGLNAATDRWTVKGIISF
jgi:hypothetical protein